MRRYSFTLLSLFLSGCMPLIQRQRIVLKTHQLEHFGSEPKTAAPVPPITIWVHGTQLVSGKLLHKLCFSPKGLTKICDIDEIYQSQKVGYMLSDLDSSRFNRQHYYLFGWSGKLSFSERKKAAQDLYEHLKNLSTEYQTRYGVKPKIRLITHSHGGNVALNLASVSSSNDDISIEELVLLGCPIQHETAHKAQHPMFKKIYSFFSTLDTLQVIDPQGLQKWDKDGLPKDMPYKRRLLSDRCFVPHPKIKQIQIKMHGRGIMHVEFLLTKFLKLLPALLHEVDQLDPQDTRIKLIHIKK